MEMEENKIHFSPQAGGELMTLIARPDFTRNFLPFYLPHNQVSLFPWPPLAWLAGWLRPAQSHDLLLFLFFVDNVQANKICLDFIKSLL